MHVGSLTIGRGILEPGWRWSTSMKPIQGTPSCQVHHLEILLAGRFRVEMDDGTTAEFGPGDALDVTPGHDAWVVGEESVVLVDVFRNVGAIDVPGEHERRVVMVTWQPDGKSLLSPIREFADEPMPFPWIAAGPGINA